MAQFSAASYAEAGHVAAPGIFRDVTLQVRLADGVNDAFVHASYDHYTGEGSLRVEASRGGQAIDAVVRIPELTLELPAGTEVRIPSVDPRSAEVLRLYKATISTPGETATLQVGFRSIAVEDAQFKVNGGGSCCAESTATSTTPALAGWCHRTWWRPNCG